MNPRALRLLRGVVVTSTAVVLSSAAHLAAGGAAPGLIGLATALVLGTVLGTALLAGGRLTATRTAATIAGGQVVFHTVFSWGSAESTVVSAAHAHDTVAALPTDALLAHDAGGMVLAHVVAGVLSLAVLLVEQRLLDRVVSAARRAVARLLALGTGVLPGSSFARLIIGDDDSAPSSRTPRGLVRRRGPPALLPAI